MAHIRFVEVAANIFPQRRDGESESCVIGVVGAWTLIIPLLSDIYWAGMTTLL
jgi:hypothetical protein